MKLQWFTTGLRAKVLSLISATFLILFLGQFTAARIILLNSYAKLEEEKARVNAERLQKALSAEIDQLDSAASDHAAWDDTYAFVENGNADYLASNFAKSTFIEYGINAFLIIDRSGQIVARQGFDLESEQERDLPPDLLKLIAKPDLLIQQSAPISSIKGIVILSEGAMLVASHPIVTSEYQGPIRGTLILGRFLNDARLEQLAEITRLPLSLHRYDRSQLPTDVQFVLGELSKDKPTAIKTLNQDTISSYALIRDLFGQPALILQAEMARSIYAQGQTSLKYYFWSTLAIGLAFCLLILLLLEKLILSRLSYLSREVSQIGTSGSLSARVLLPGKDELSSLANTINWTLERLGKSQQALQESEERYTLSVQGANDGVWDWNLLTDKVYLSSRWKDMLGWKENESDNHLGAWLDRIHHDDLERFKSGLLAHFQGKTPHFESEHRIRHQDGTYRWVLSRGLAVRDAQGKAYRMAGSQTDLSSRRVLYDQLTGLSNRTLFLDQLERALKQTKRQDDYLFAVIFLDCDRFKVINDSLGHLVGDQLLIQVARRLEACLRPGDVVARLGGDEFTILLENIQDISDATRVASRINQELMRPFNLTGRIAYISASIGIALNSPDCNQPEELLRNADTAMYRAKALGKARYEVFDATMHAQAQERLQLETDLRQAIERCEFQLHYQPIVSLVTEAVIGFEALIRWQHPQRGLIFPEDFMPVAEETGLITSISQWVLQEACHQMGVWQRKFPASQPLTIGVNLSRKQLSQLHLVQRLELILQETGLDASSLKLEVTETALMDDREEVAAQILSQLKELGVQLSVDDFGTGYSSLSCLHYFPIDTLKIDRSFVNCIRSRSKDSEIVQAIVTLAHNLGIEVTAEGVETDEQLVELKTLKCDRAQGYFFSKPLVPEVVEVWMAGFFAQIMPH